MNLLNLLIVISCNTLVILAANSLKDTTTLSRPIEILSSRRKRSLLLPDHGSIKLTIGIGKALIAKSPKGLSLSWEISNYYSGPTAIKDWQSELPVSHQPVEKLSDYFQTTSNKHQNLLNPRYGGTVSYANPFLSALSERPGQSLYNGLKSKQTTADRQHSTLHRFYKRSDVGSGNRLSRWMSDGQSKHTSPLEEILTLLLGTNVKCSILRSICRSKEFLLPPGYSMIQDIVRTVFFIPYRKHASDVAGPSLCNSTSDCDLEDESNHSFNFLDWILNPKKIG